MSRRLQLRLCTLLVAVWVVVFPPYATAWNIPGHMLSGSIAFQILRRESAPTIEKVITILERHPWYVNQWPGQLEKVPSIDRDDMLFMLAARWADDVRTKDRNQHRGPLAILWRYQES